jgi:hypothetical protein
MNVNKIRDATKLNLFFRFFLNMYWLLDIKIWMIESFQNDFFSLHDEQLTYAHRKKKRSNR